MLVAAQLVIWFYLMPKFSVLAAFSNFNFSIIVLATLLIAIGGYILNDIKDLPIDKINTPDKVWIPSVVSEKTAYLYSYGFTGIGLVLGLYVSISISYYIGFLWFVIPVILLYYYAVKAKKVLLIGNVLVSFLVSFSMIIIVIFPFIIADSLRYKYFKNILIALIFFSFTLNLIREIIKDAEDVIGDKANGVKSIPIVFGYEKTNQIVIIISSSIIGALFFIATMAFRNNELMLGLYLIFGVVMAFILFIQQLIKATEVKHYTKLSTLLKIIMLVGMLSVFMLK